MNPVIAVEVTVNAMTNTLLNGLCAWLIYRRAAVVPCGFAGIMIDAGITCTAICFCTVPFSVAAAKRHLKSGALKNQEIKDRRFSYLPRHPLLLALFFALPVILPLGLLLGWGFSFLGITELPVFGFVLYKGILGGLLGGCVCAAALIRWLSIHIGSGKLLWTSTSSAC